MRVKRLKTCKKLVSFYKTTYGFREPYQILVDLTFCQHALMYKINIKEQVPKYIEGSSQLYTTSCILEEGKLLGPQLHGAVLVCKQFKLRKCSHKEPVTAQECIESLVGSGNEHHLFVASQDSELRKKLRKITGVPLLHIHYNALVLEKPSRHTLKEAGEIDSTKVSTTSFEKSQINKMKQLNDIEEERLPSLKRRRRKGVNPLAMKKKTKKDIDKTTTDTTKKRRRKKQKLAEHILEELQKKKEDIG